jgi:predicted transporter
MVFGIPTAKELNAVADKTRTTALIIVVPVLLLLGVIAVLLGKIAYSGNSDLNVRVALFSWWMILMGKSNTTCRNNGDGDAARLGTKG